MLCMIVADFSWEWQSAPLFICVSYCAGLRAKMGAGFCRMNDLTIIQTTQVIICDLKLVKL